MLGVVAMLTLAAAPLDLYVSPTGNDANPGTQARPFATLQHTRDAVRARADRTGPATVHLAGGVYYLPETLIFTPEDSGTATAPTTWTAEPGAAPVLSGGLKLTMTWTPYRDGILQASTPAGLEIDQLFVNGARQPMARYPNFDPNQPIFNGFAADAISPARVARWANPAGGYIHAMHAAHWGGYSYRITGKHADGTLAYEGGWQNNRQMGMHPQHRYVENVFEELDAPGEWYHDAKSGTLYYLPAAGVDPAAATFEVVRLRSLVEVRGSQATPVRHLTLSGLTFRHAARTFMDTREPLLRSDWTIYRGGCVLFDGAEDCTLADCTFDQVGGNTVFVNNYNRRVTVRGCDIHDSGGNGVCFVGDPRAVRSPLFEAGQHQDAAAIDRGAGPKGDNYPADCLVDDCLITRTGRVEKQSAPIQISMSQGITVRHCSLYEVPRAGINISEGTWGGHVIEFCDVFDTVLETGDHGSFNSWGRDRWWQLRGAADAELPALVKLDAVRPTILRNSRWRCDHGWDIDLDDGSSNYEIRDNLLLAGGLKLREGFGRTAENNVIVNNSLHPHVWFAASGDVFRHNIVMGAYRPAGGMPGGKWGSELDFNLFTTSDADRTRFAANGCDAHSLVGPADFVDPAHGDYRVKDGSLALRLGFRDFAMDQFGVQKPALRAIARTPELPALLASPAAAVERVSLWQGAVVHGLVGEEFSAYGVSRESGGVQLRQMAPRSALAVAGLQTNDLLQSVNGQPVRNVAELLLATDAAAGGPLTLGYVRGQARHEARLTDYLYAVSESASAEFKILRPAPDAGIHAITAQPAPHNEPLATLTDGKVAANYGPVFGNDMSSGSYKADLGELVAVSEVRGWSFAQNGNRGSQHFLLYASSSPVDPGWDRSAWTPVTEVQVAAADRFLATAIRRAGGQPLGTWRWLLWVSLPVTEIGEHTAWQELQVVRAR